MANLTKDSIQMKLVSRLYSVDPQILSDFLLVSASTGTSTALLILTYKRPWKCFGFGEATSAAACWMAWADIVSDVSLVAWFKFSLLNEVLNKNELNSPSVTSAS